MRLTFLARMMSQGLDLSSCLRNKNTWINSFEDTGHRPTKDRHSRENRNERWWALWLSQLTTLKESLSCDARKGPRQSLTISLSWEDRTESGKTRALKFKCRILEREMYKELQRSAEDPPPGFSWVLIGTHTWGNYSRLGKARMRVRNIALSQDLVPSVSWTNS